MVSGPSKYMRSMARYGSLVAVLKFAANLQHNLPCSREIKLGPFEKYRESGICHARKLPFK